MRREKPPLDSKAVIIARQEAQPNEESTVLVKNGQNRLMQHSGENNVSFCPYKDDIPQPEAAKALKPSMGEWDYRWCNEAELNRTSRWVPVECDIKDPNGRDFFSSECYAPFARGSKVDLFIHRMDTVLCHCRLDQSRKINDGIVLRSNPALTPAQAKQEMLDSGATDATASFTQTEDKVEITDKR